MLTQRYATPYHAGSTALSSQVESALQDNKDSVATGHLLSVGKQLRFRSAVLELVKNRSADVVFGQLRAVMSTEEGRALECAGGNGVKADVAEIDVLVL